MVKIDCYYHSDEPYCDHFLIPSINYAILYSLTIYYSQNLSQQDSVNLNTWFAAG